MKEIKSTRAENILSNFYRTDMIIEEVLTGSFEKVRIFYNSTDNINAKPRIIGLCLTDAEGNETRIGKVCYTINR